MQNHKHNKVLYLTQWPTFLFVQSLRSLLQKVRCNRCANEHCIMQKGSNMNSTRYVGKISEISHLPEAEQVAAIEKARHEAFVNLGLAGRAAAYLIMCLVLGFLIAALPVLFLGFPTIIGLPFLAGGILFANLTYQKLYFGLLIRGLKNIEIKPHHA